MLDHIDPFCKNGGNRKWTFRKSFPSAKVEAKWQVQKSETLRDLQKRLGLVQAHSCSAKILNRRQVEAVLTQKAMACAQTAVQLEDQSLLQETRILRTV